MVDYNTVKTFIETSLLLWKRKIENISITDIAQCLRKTYYEYIYGISLSSNLSMLISMSEGIGVHKIISDCINVNMQDKCKSEVYLEMNLDKFKLTGRIDAVCRINDELVILEFKTTRIKIDKKFVKTYNIHYIRQVKYYMCLWNMLNEEKISKGYLIYFTPTYMYAYEVNYNENDCKEMIERASKLWKCLKFEIIPEYEVSKYCEICYFRYKCFNREITEYLAQSPL